MSETQNLSIQKDEKINAIEREDPDDFMDLPLDDFPRLIKLREELRRATKKIFIERAALITRFHRENGFDRERPVLDRARGLKYVLENLPVTVFDDELIVGGTSKHRLGCLVFPELMGMSIWAELPGMKHNTTHPDQITDREIDVLANDVFPFWKDDTVGEFVRREGNDPVSNEIMEYMIFYLVTKSSCLGHLVVHFKLILDHGVRGLAEMAENLRKKAPDKKKAAFYEAARVCLEGLEIFIKRHARYCEDLAGPGPRGDELRHITENLYHIARKPPETFEQALQLIWLVQMALFQESINAAYSFGRLDQILFPLYRKDIESGRISRERAAELVGCFFIKMGDHTPLVPATGEEIIGGGPPGQALTLGGVLPDGSDGVNELTYLMLKMSELLALREPNTAARLSVNSPEKYWKAVTRSLINNGAVPAMYNDDVIVDSLQQNGFSLEDARDYGLVGCVEPTSAGRTMSHTGAILFNLGSCLELAMNDGVHPTPGIRIGPATGAFEGFASWPDFREAFFRQVEHLADLAVDCNNRYAEAHRKIFPTPLLSSLVEGPFDKGKDVTDGGARYNTSGVAIIGFADVVDSLAAVKTLVFEEKRFSLAELAGALKDDFLGYERILALVEKKAPKYGAGNPDADALAAEVVRRIGDIFGRHENPRGGSYTVGYWSVSLHAGLGRLAGALPNGKRKDRPFASGATPCSNVPGRVPTASLCSTAGLPHGLMANGIANNHRISRTLIKQNGKQDVLEHLIKGYFKEGGMQVQFIIQDKQVLLDALKDPDEYPDLLVRVSGYTAYFNDLTEAMKKEIISRAEDTL